MGKEFRIQNSEFRMPARTFQDSAAWQNAHKFVLAVYTYTGGFPRVETYGLTSQFRRASLEESRYYVMLSQDLGYGSSVELMCLFEETSKVLNSYAKAILNSDS